MSDRRGSNAFFAEAAEAMERGTAHQQGKPHCPNNHELEWVRDGAYERLRCTEPSCKYHREGL